MIEKLYTNLNNSNPIELEHFWNKIHNKIEVLVYNLLTNVNE